MTAGMLHKDLITKLLSTIADACEILHEHVSYDTYHSVAS